MWVLGNLVTKAWFGVGKVVRYLTLKAKVVRGVGRVRLPFRCRNRKQRKKRKVVARFKAQHVSRLNPGDYLGNETRVEKKVCRKGEKKTERL